MQVGLLSSTHGLLLPPCPGSYRLLYIDYDAAADQVLPVSSAKPDQQVVQVTIITKEASEVITSVRTCTRHTPSNANCLPAEPQHLRFYRNATVAARGGAITVHLNDGDISPDPYQPTGRPPVAAPVQTLPVEPLSRPRMSVGRAAESHSARWPDHDQASSFYLWTTSSWASNFEHLMSQYVPKLVDYWRLREVYRGHPAAAAPPWLLLPTTATNSWVDQLVRALQLDSFVIPLEVPHDARYLVRRLYVQRAFSTDSVASSAILLYRRLREAIIRLPGGSSPLPLIQLQSRSSAALGHGPRRIYLQRETSPSAAHNDAFSGSGSSVHFGAWRNVANEDQLVSAMEGEGFVAIRLGRATLVEKAHALRDAESIVTPLGANAVNLLFGQRAQAWLFLDPPHVEAFHASQVNESYTYLYGGHYAACSTYRAARIPTWQSGSSQAPWTLHRLQLPAIWYLRQHLPASL
jgi:hypothetical protein